jgi:hypothetical protein
MPRPPSQTVQLGGNIFRRRPDLGIAYLAEFTEGLQRQNQLHLQILRANSEFELHETTRTRAQHANKGGHTFRDTLRRIGNRGVPARHISDLLLDHGAPLFSSRISLERIFKEIFFGGQ